MRILHLAYEDPRQPGSGGGSVRTWEINRRIGVHHEITALVAAYPGATERVEDGVRWIPIGAHTGTRADRLTYFGLANLCISRHPHDILIEDFGAPFSVAFSPRFTRRPVVASVQWLFARQMRAKYHLPFDWAERIGLALYNDFISVSDWLAAELRARRPNATIEVIPNGVEEIAFTIDVTPPTHLLFVGRLDVDQKGGDMLFEIAARVAARLGDRMPPLLVVGDGPDRVMMERTAERLGISRKVEFRGRVEGLEKYRLMASAFAVLMPSRHETFGMVAVEGQAAGAPVVAFDVGPLRDVVGEGNAHLVPPFDLDAFVERTIDLVTQPAQAHALRMAGRAWARRYDWTEIAARQEAHYERAVRLDKEH